MNKYHKYWIDRVIWLLILSTTLASHVFTQCPEINKIEAGGIYDGKLSNYNHKTDKLIIFSESKYGESIDSIIKHYEFVSKKAEQYILNRAGKKFLEKLKFWELVVIYRNSKTIDNFDDIKYDINKFDEVSYYIKYKYIHNGAQYRFGIEFDKNGNRTSEHAFPDGNTNKEFEKIIPFCEAVSFARTTPYLKDKPLGKGQLEYLHDINSFVWLLEEGMITFLTEAKYRKLNPNPEPNNRYLIYIDAQTNQIVKTKKISDTSLEEVEE